MSEKQMSAAERAARQMMQDKKEAEATDKAYMRSLTSTMPAPAASSTVRKAKGGMIGGASKRADGCAQRGKTRGKMI